MQEYRKIPMKKEEIVPIASKMRSDGVHLAMIHAFFDKKDVPFISYEYDIDGVIHSYTVEGEKTVPSIAGIYDLGAEWAEREIMELMDITFEGLDHSKRLFMPESMFSEEGHILVAPMEELIKDRDAKEGDK